VKVADTNLVLRIITGDDPAQAAAASSIVSGGSLITSGVWIEAEWVLRSSYSMCRKQITEALAQFLVFEGVAVFNRPAMAWAIARYEKGADWADMMHLVDAARYDSFVTFDRALPKGAGSNPPTTIELLQ